MQMKGRGAMASHTLTVSSQADFTMIYVARLSHTEIMTRAPARSNNPGFSQYFNTGNFAFRMTSTGDAG